MHGCPPGCPYCRHEAAQAGVPGLLSEWEDFVRSRDALRLAVLCQRSGRPFDRVSNDDVVQFCVEEAVFERLHLAEVVANKRRARQLAEDEAGNAELQAALERARGFADTGVAS